ncbi:unnamed protein product [Phaedon cochleariae]|uniref:Uncharacterized protein n=1 Tax=Phaedon cochleariae TaxID=80249 RepID=A0A9N9X5G8_PHACE|nr:unnamed protein product [Phaedon cochleariae]
MEEPKLVDFSVIKQKIIKTDEVLQMYLETDKKLKKAQLVIKNMKSKYDQANSSLNRVQLEYERCTYTLESTKSKYDDLQVEHQQMMEQKSSLEQKYSSHLVDSQSSILELQDELKMMRDLTASAEKLSSSPKKKTVSDNNSNKKFRDLEVRFKRIQESEQKLREHNESLLLDNKQIIEEITKMKIDHSRVVALLQLEKSKIDHDFKQLRSQMDSEKRQHNTIKDKDFEISKLKAEVLALRELQEQIKNLQEQNKKLNKDLLYKDLTTKVHTSHAESQTPSTPETEPKKCSCPEIINENKIMICSFTQTEALTEETVLTDDAVDDILKEMLFVPQMLSPMRCQSRESLILDDISEPVPKFSPRIPDIIITPSTPLEENQMSFAEFPIADAVDLESTDIAPQDLATEENIVADQSSVLDLNNIRNNSVPPLEENQLAVADNVDQEITDIVRQDLATEENLVSDQSSGLDLSNIRNNLVPPLKDNQLAVAESSIADDVDQEITDIVPQVLDTEENLVTDQSSGLDLSDIRNNLVPPLKDNQLAVAEFSIADDVDQEITDIVPQDLDTEENLVTDLSSGLDLSNIRNNLVPPLKDNQLAVAEFSIADDVDQEITDIVPQDLDTEENLVTDLSSVLDLSNLRNNSLPPREENQLAVAESSIADDVDQEITDIVPQDLDTEENLLAVAELSITNAVDQEITAIVPQDLATEENLVIDMSGVLDLSNIRNNLVPLLKENQLAVVEFPVADAVEQEKTVIVPQDLAIEDNLVTDLSSVLDLSNSKNNLVPKEIITTDIVLSDSDKNLIQNNDGIKENNTDRFGNVSSDSEKNAIQINDDIKIVLDLSNGGKNPGEQNIASDGLDNKVSLESDIQNNYDDKNVPNLSNSSKLLVAEERIPSIKQVKYSEKVKPATVIKNPFRKRRYRPPIRGNNNSIKQQKLLKQAVLLNKRYLFKRGFTLRKLKTQDSVLRALQVLKRSKINFTISNESTLPLHWQEQRWLNKHCHEPSNYSPPPVLIPKHPQTTEKQSVEKLGCPSCYCNKMYMLLSGKSRDPCLHGFFKVKNELASPLESRMDAVTEDKPENPLKWLNESLKKEITPENLLDTLAELVSQKLRDDSVAKRKRSSPSENSDFYSETETEIDRLFPDPKNILERNKMLLKKAKYDRDRQSTSATSLEENDIKNVSSQTDDKFDEEIKSPEIDERMRQQTPEGKSQVMVENVDSCDSFKFSIPPDLISPLSTCTVTDSPKTITSQAASFQSPMRNTDLADQKGISRKIEFKSPSSLVKSKFSSLFSPIKLERTMDKRFFPTQYTSSQQKNIDSNYSAAVNNYLHLYPLRGKSTSIESLENLETSFSTTKMVVKTNNENEIENVSLESLVSGIVKLKNASICSVKSEVNATNSEPKTELIDSKVNSLDMSSIDTEKEPQMKRDLVSDVEITPNSDTVINKFLMNESQMSAEVGKFISNFDLSRSFRDTSSPLTSKQQNTGRKLFVEEGETASPSTTETILDSKVISTKPEDYVSLGLDLSDDDSDDNKLPSCTPSPEYNQNQELDDWPQSPESSVAQFSENKYTKIIPLERTIDTGQNTNLWHTETAASVKNLFYKKDVDSKEEVFDQYHLDESIERDCKDGESPQSPQASQIVDVARIITSEKIVGLEIDELPEISELDCPQSPEPSTAFSVDSEDLRIIPLERTTLEKNDQNESKYLDSKIWQSSQHGISVEFKNSIDHQEVNPEGKLVEPKDMDHLYSPQSPLSIRFDTNTPQTSRIDTVMKISSIEKIIEERVDIPKPDDHLHCPESPEPSDAQVSENENIKIIPLERTTREKTEQDEKVVTVGNLIGKEGIDFENMNQLDSPQSPQASQIENVTKIIPLENIIEDQVEIPKPEDLLHCPESPEPSDAQLSENENVKIIPLERTRQEKTEQDEKVVEIDNLIGKQDTDLGNMNQLESPQSPQASQIENGTRINPMEKIIGTEADRPEPVKRKRGRPRLQPKVMESDEGKTNIKTRRSTRLSKALVKSKERDSSENENNDINETCGTPDPPLCLRRSGHTILSKEFISDSSDSENDAQNTTKKICSETSIASNPVSVKNSVDSTDISQTLPSIPPIKSPPIKRPKNKAMSRLKSNVLRQMKQKMKMFRTEAPVRVIQSNCDVKNSGIDKINLEVKEDTTGLQEAPPVNKKITVVQNFLIPPGSSNPVDLLKSTLEPCTSQNSLPAEHIPVRRKPNKKSNVGRNSGDILSKIMGQMDRDRPAPAVNRQVVHRDVPVGIEDKQWRRGVLDIAEIVHNKDARMQDSYGQQPAHMDASGLLKRGAELTFKMKIMVKKLVNIPNEDEIPKPILLEFKRLKVDVTIDLIIHEVAKDFHDKPINKYYPAPLMTRTQRIYLSLLVSLEKEITDGILEKFLSRTQLYIQRIGCGIQAAIPLTRLFLAVCRLKADINRMRTFCCEAFFYNGNLAVPILFTVLTSWVEVIPMAVDVENYPMAKVLVQLVHLKTFFMPGYNLIPLRCLLHQYHGYPKERRNCDELFEEIFQHYLRNPNPTSDFAIRLYCRNKDNKWVYKKINEFFKPLIYKIPMENVNFKSTAILLMGKICRQFRAKEDHDAACLIELNRFFSGLIEEGMPDLVRQSVQLSIDRLPKKKEKFKKPGTPA